MLHLHPAKQRKFIEILVRKREEKEKKFSKKNFKIYLPVENKFSTFAPALRDKRNKTEDTFVDILN